jgi:hypothetical protein
MEVYASSPNQFQFLSYMQIENQLISRFRCINTQINQQSDETTCPQPVISDCSTLDTAKLQLTFGNGIISLRGQKLQQPLYVLSPSESNGTSYHSILSKSNFEFLAIDKNKQLTVFR